MLDPIIFKFLGQLKSNNNREWFAANKDLFESAKKSFESFCTEMISEIKNIDPKVGLIDAKDCIFRIYRDTRFAHDKTPYKPNFGCFVATGGRKSDKPGYYVHLETEGQSMLAGGLYMPTPQYLESVRQEILHNADSFLAFAEDPQFKAFYNGFFGDRLKTVPKGYPKDFEHKQYLSLKSFTVAKPLPDDYFASSDFLDEFREAVRQMKRLNDFLWEAID